MPSPAEDRPGLLIRDPYRYTDVALIIPPVLVECLACFDGEQTDLDLNENLVRLTGDLQAGEVGRSLIDALSQSGLLENEVFERLQEERHREFAEAPKREAVYAGAAYPDELGDLNETMCRYMGVGSGQAAATDGLLGIAAPHVSPEGGWMSYQAAYRALAPGYKDRTFVVLGTSHYGEPERFGLTRKPFITPMGETSLALPLLEQLAAQAPGAIHMEDYCHAIEHSIEFQVLFLQHIYGPDIRVLPILCGSFAHSIYRGGKPEDDANVARFLDALGEMAAREGDRLFWVLGIDMAHMGRRYGDQFTAIAEEGEMAEVAERDRARIQSVAGGDPAGFWSLVQENHDSLKWCGSSPLYTFLKTVPQARGTLLRYEQWNIDEQSVVSFGGISFAKA